MSDSLFSMYDALLLDLDGTVYRGPDALDGAADAVAVARAAGLAVRFATNNASRSADSVAAHLARLGMPAQPSEVDTSAQAAARMLAARLPERSTVLVVGAKALAAEVDGAGLRSVPDVSSPVAAVVQGFSTDVCWHNLADACVAINSGALWIACNADPTLPTERGDLPGNGALVIALHAATGVDPLVAGKPQPPLLRQSIESAGTERPLVVGDRLDTDIAGAVAVGADSLLVLTGVTDAARLLRAPREQRPTYVAADLTAIEDEPDLLRINAVSGKREGWHVTVERDVLAVDGTDYGTDREMGQRDLALLRALCASWWAHVGTGAAMPELRPISDGARRALAGLGLAEPSKHPEDSGIARASNDGSTVQDRLA